MKSKLIRKFALLLVVITFMTQVLHFPVKAAEISGGEIIDIERESESGSIAGTETTIETDIATDIETETMTDTESITGTETETGIQTEETEGIEETEVKTERAAVDETVSEVETTVDDLSTLEEEKEGVLYITSDANYDIAYEILELVNEERKDYGIGPLTMDKDLLDAAIQRAIECKLYYSHTRPNGKDCVSICSDKISGENIIWGYIGAKTVVNDWMNSSEDREKILDSSYQSVGIGVFEAGVGTTFVQCFGVGEADEVKYSSNIESKTYEIKYINSLVQPSLGTERIVQLYEGETHHIVIRAGNIDRIRYGNGDAINCSSYEWVSSNDSIATVDELGVVKGVRKGSATITGTNKLNKESKLILEVTVSNVYLTDPEINPKINAEYHTISEIEDYMSKSGVTGKDVITYKKKPVTSGNYDPGELSSDTLDSALAVLNQMRYIAGISHDIALNNEYNEEAQAAALVNYVNRELTHWPTQPSDMSDSLYQLGYKGAGHSNLYWAGSNANFYKLIEGWLSDSDDDNINRVGHRRWILNPNMKQTGFGAVSDNGTFAAIYAHDGGSVSSNIKVTWPAQNMPTTYFDAFDAWSVSINKYVDKSTVNVTLTRKDDNKQWYFSEKSSDGYFNVDNQGYGQIGCIIFCPELSGENYADGDLFNVDITYGESQHLTYNVQFFEPFKTYNITYELNGGTNNSENPDSFRVFSDTIILKDPAKNMVLSRDGIRTVSSRIK